MDLTKNECFSKYQLCWKIFYGYWAKKFQKYIIVKMKVQMIAITKKNNIAETIDLDEVIHAQERYNNNVTKNFCITKTNICYLYQRSN